MKQLLFFLTLAILSLSCGNKTQNTNSNAATVATETPAAKNETPKPQPTKYITNNSRPADQISQDYPFDIPMTNGKGEAVNTSKAFKKNGKPTVLLFWLTTCVPCRYEMKAIAEKYEGWTEQADFNFYAISTDFPKNYEAFKSVVAKNNWGWETYHDTNREFRNIMPGQLNGLPQTFLLDKDGNIAYHKRKYSSGDEDKLFAEIQQLSK